MRANWTLWILPAAVLLCYPRVADTQSTVAAKLPAVAVTTAGNPGDTVAPVIDAAVVRRQLTNFQVILSRELQASFDQPFGFLQDPKGSYLSRYGAVFHMEVNLVPLRILSMFDYRPYTEEELRKTRDSKAARIQELKLKVADLLLANGQELMGVPIDQQVAVVVHLFNMPSERVEGLPTQVVVEVSRKALTEAKAGLISKDEYHKQVSFLEL